jgi:hypothetical protein
MRLGIMQPYFFPYIGYFELIGRTDRWVVFDVVQYNDKSWMTRNRILHPTEGWQYINLPVIKAPHGTPIHQIRAKDKGAAHKRIRGQLEHYRKHAPHFADAIAVLDLAFSSPSDRLVDINVAGIKAVCAYLRIAFEYSVCSTMDIDLRGVEHAGQWALKISSQLGATEYINPPGGRAIFKQDEWDQAGIRLSFTELPDLTYSCAPYEFVAGLSILDVLMWNDADTVRSAVLGRQ